MTRMSAMIKRLPSLPTVALGLAATVILFGGLVLYLGAGRACGGFPLCNGGFLPMGSTPRLTALLHTNWTHRVLAYLLCALVFAGAYRVWRAEESPRALRTAAGLAAIAVTAQAVVGGMLVTYDLWQPLRHLHAFIGTIVLASLVVWAVTAARIRSAFRVL